MIPICDEQGRVIAFGGRTLGDDQVKYLNSPETPIYTKGRISSRFTWPRILLKPRLRSCCRRLFRCDYSASLWFHQYGGFVGNGSDRVSSEELVRLQQSKRVYLAFDADAAGAKAVERGGGDSECR